MLLTDALRAAAIVAWLICLACLSPAVGRMFTRRSLYLDPVWGIVFLLALNRLSFLFRINAILSFTTAFILALVMGAGSIWYQKHDR
jgi:lipopolysaccharide export LptBFGC system permease protein LptF